MSNELDTWIIITGTKAAHLARKVGVSDPYIHDLRKGKRRPSPDVAKRIEDATDGWVEASSWYDQ
jgi:DNA-binding transcriptional regulator YdaS (Cro superfamily)